jgi:HD-GYP domain-containing protein (c-di-GMP phosphodiesterase class II)
MTEFKLKEIRTGACFSDDVYLDKQFLLLTPDIPVSYELMQILKNWNVKGLLSYGELKSVPSSDKKTETPKKQTVLVETPSKQAALNDNDKIANAEEFYKVFTHYIKSVFIQVASSNEFDYSDVTSHVTEACVIIRQDRRFLLRAQKKPAVENADDYLASHAVRCMIISVIMGLYLKLSNERLVELGTAALLHEIGMLKLPASSKGYFNKRPLTQDEKRAIYSHPVLSYKLLNSFEVPLIVCLAGLEHHERENGSGYPQRLTGDKISLYAKIIAVVCSYEALTSKRPHKDAKDGYTGMLDLLKNEGKQYDETIVRALLYSISMYPIGLYVILSNGKKGQVVDVNPGNPFYPIVQIFGVFTEKGDNLVVQTAKDGLFIVGTVKKEES